MQQDYQKEIEDIIGQMQCPKDFRCYKDGSHNLCKAKDVGLASYVMCLNKSPNGCGFSVAYAYAHYCRCPLRVYMAKTFKK